MGKRLDGAVSADLISRVRGFNRFYTRVVGALDEGHLHSPFSLAAARVIYEVAHSADVTPTALVRDLRLDAGYLSRLLADLQAKGLLDRSRQGKSQTRLSLTARGKRTFSKLEANARKDIARLLSPLHEECRRQVIVAMETIQSSFSQSGKSAAPVILRDPRAGDLGWVVARHGALYAAEYGFNRKFEALVAQIVADFGANLDPKRERCWIAEVDRKNVGSVFLVKHPDRAGVAKLRLLLVEPEARGLGIGRRLVDECAQFAKAAKYRKIVLWTNSVLISARRIYEAAGYKLVDEERHHSFGKNLVGQNWKLSLS